MKTGYFKLGFEFALGAMVAICISLTIASWINDAFKPHDSCDGPNGRCGMSILTDHKTGLQYLRTPDGGLYPRMTIDGKQMRDGE
ncbi:hypothetical protein [Phytohalomonas tamaricis]|uniref:hypothetical protein n=1 Tax=Phytohalomonas tamaricis TaxID=2081032 RepID=UPI000D0B504A|nr:hypothetical protein [Phytohalomonas tamaricis]